MTTTADRSLPRAADRAAQDSSTYSLIARAGAEVLGTFVLVLGGVGTALFAANFPSAESNSLGVGFLGVALAFGLSLTVGILAVGHVSGGHFNPAVTVGLAVARRAAWRDVPVYVLAQLIGGALATTVLAAVAASGPAGFLAAARESGFASNGFGAHSPGDFGLPAVLIAETVLTALFVATILAVTSRPAQAAVAPVMIGLTLVVVHLVLIPISNSSVNPARSLAAAIYGGPDALGQVWVFFVAPIVGAAIAGWLHRALASRPA